MITFKTLTNFFKHVNKEYSSSGLTSRLSCYVANKEINPGTITDSPPIAEAFKKPFLAHQNNHKNFANFVNDIIKTFCKFRKPFFLLLFARNHVRALAIIDYKLELYDANIMHSNLGKYVASGDPSALLQKLSFREFPTALEVSVFVSGKDYESIKKEKIKHRFSRLSQSPY